MTDISDFAAREVDLPAGADGFYLPSAIRSDDKLLPPTGLFYLERGKFNRFFLDLDQDMDGFLASKSGKTRSTLRRKLRKFEKESGGEIDWRVYSGPQELSVFYNLAIKLAEKSYQARLYDAALPDNEEFRSGMLQKAERGQVVGFLLFLKDEPIAYLYAPIVGSRVIYGYLGFDSEYKNLSPGTVLQLKAMEWCFTADGLQEFDFTEGEGAHKRLFSTHSKPCVDMLVLRKNSRLRLLAVAFKLTQKSSQAFSRLLDRIGVKARIRKWLHRSSR